MALSFNGSSSYLQSGLVQGYPFTYAAWIRPASLHTAGVLGCGRLDINFRAHYIRSNSAGTVTGISIVNGSDSGVTATTSNSYSAGAWSHVAYAGASATNKYCVLNGNWAARGTNTNSFTPTGLSGFRLGDYPNSTSHAFFNGEIAEFAVWSVALSEQEIAALALGYSPLVVRRRSLVAYQDLIRRVNRPGVGSTFTSTATSVVPHPRIFNPLGRETPHIAPPPTTGPPYRLVAAGLHTQRPQRGIYIPAAEASLSVLPGIVAGRSIPHTAPFSEEPC